MTFAQRLQLPRPAGLPLAVTAGALAVAVIAVAARTGRLGYAVDDAYIHLTLAEHLVDDGTFGLLPGRYESASSSPGWTLALAAGRVLRVPATWLPLILAGACALGASVLLGPSRRVAASVGPIGRLGVALLPVTAGLAPLALTGMEHAAHVLVVLLVLHLVADQRHDRGWLLPCLLAIGTAVRFETAFVAAGLATLSLAAAWPRPLRASRGLLRAVIPVVAVIAAFAAINLAYGQGALPNSIVAKAALDGSLLPDPAETADRLTEDWLLTALLVVVAVLATRWRQDQRASRVAIVMTITAVCHLAYADVGWFYRYQAYLIAGALFTIVLAMQGSVSARTRGLLGALLLLAAAPRAAVLLDTAPAADDVHRNQEQVGRFLASERPGSAVALNDIGFPSFLHDGDIVDLYGLADHRVLELRRDRAFDRPALEALLTERRAELMVIYEDAFGALVPEGWARVERWCFPDSIVLSEDCIAFFASPRSTDEVRSQLAAFRGSLPRSVVALPG